MSPTIKRGSRLVSPMPVRLDAHALLRVSDQGGRIVRSESLPAGTNLHERLAVVRENYSRQEWVVGELHAGQWAFVAQKGYRRLLIAIRAESAAPGAVQARSAPERVP